MLLPTLIESQNATLISDEVELGLTLLEVFMDYGRVLALSTTFTHKSCESVSVADAGRLLDGATNVVIVVAEFVGEQLDLVW